MPSVRIAIRLGEKLETVKDPLIVHSSDGEPAFVPSISFESKNLVDLQRRVIQEVLATFKAYSDRNRGSDEETVKIYE